MLEQKDLEMIAGIVDDVVERKTQQIKDEIQKVKMILEDETNRNIQIIAEGHMDLSRKLNETLRMKEDDEMIRIRLNRLERELNELKKAIG